MQQKGILHLRSMQRRACSRMRSSARSARLLVLVIVAVTFGPRVVKCQDTAGDGSNTNIWDQRCKCNEQPKCTLSDCGNYEYCNNVGNQVSSGDDFECQQCEHGSYYKKHDVLRGYQTVKSLPEMGQVYVCTSFDEYGIQDDCSWRPEPITGSERTLQACQQCPILTVANTPFLFPKDKFLKDSSFDETEKQLIVTRCFSSCYQAWVQGANTPGSVYIPVLTADGMRYNNVDLFPEVQGDRVKNAPPLSILQSVITFSHPEVGDWLKTEEADWYRTYLDWNYHKKKITSLPAPRRQCRMCPVGKSMLMAPSLDLQVSEIWKSKINELRNGLMPYSTIAQNLKPSFAHEISWLNDDVLSDFETVGICAPCPAGTYFNDANADLATTVFGSQERLNVIKKMNEGPRKANPLLSQWKLVQLRCVPCEEGTFRTTITDVGICVLAPDNDVVVLDEVDLRWQEEPGASFKVSKTLLAQRSNSCPSGSEKKSLDKTCTLADADMGTLASSVKNEYVILKKNDCCKPCAVNFYKVSGMGMCTNVASNMATVVPYGSMQQITCARGTELKACKEKKVETSELKFNPSLADFCLRTEDINSEDDDWRVCLDCTAVEAPVMNQMEPRCVMCNGDGDVFDALGDDDVFYLSLQKQKIGAGEFYNARTGQCESCDDCSVFEPAVEWRSFFATEADKVYREAMSAWLDESNRLDSYRVYNR